MYDAVTAGTEELCAPCCVYQHPVFVLRKHPLRGVQSEFCISTGKHRAYTAGSSGACDACSGCFHFDAAIGHTTQRGVSIANLCAMRRMGFDVFLPCPALALYCQLKGRLARCLDHSSWQTVGLGHTCCEA